MDRNQCITCLQRDQLNCAEVVLKALSERYHLNLTHEDMRVIAAFGGGVCGDMCGALCGALGAMGKFHVHECAHKSGNFVDSCREFVDFFEKRMGGITCTKLYEKYATEEDGCLETVMRALDTYDAYRKKEEKERMKIVIVGGVAGGASAAARLRRNDEQANIILLEKGEFISFANCGLPYYIGGVITDGEELQLQTPESFHARFNIDVRVKNEVLSVDVENKWVVIKDHTTGEIYHERYDKLILSPGSSPIHPFQSSIAADRIFTLRNIPDTYAIRSFVDRNHPATCAVIGAGFIGLEVAENMIARGVRVSVIEAAPHVLAPIDMDTAHEVHNYLREQGLGLYIGKKCTEIGKGYVMLDDGTRVDADMVVLSIGVAPETGFLKDSGIELGRRGEILVNQYMQTSVQDVYALGDAVAVTNFATKMPGIIALAGPANKQGRMVADTICGRPRTYERSLGTSVVKLFDMTVAVTGAKEEVLSANGIAYCKSFTYSASHASYYPGASMMQIKLLFAPRTGLVLGAQIVGYDGVDKRIDSLANAIRFGLTIYDLQKMDLAYAPPFSSAKDPVNMAGYVAENILDGSMIPYYVEDINSIPADAIKLDVRTTEEYNAGTIPGFINIPVDELRDRLNELDKSKEIYVTCQIGLRGYIAQRILMGNGYRTKNLSGGYRRYLLTTNDR